ncbi:MAG: hypothetical protein JWP56_1856 [Aeromicrobium sp.]|nr:hypothetical protein [Aeromicrobium sp.]
MTPIEQSTTRVARSRRFVKPAAVVVVLIAVVAGYVFWWSKPTAFGGWGDEVGATVKVGQTLNVDMGLTYSAEVVSLHHARPVVVKNSADAELELVACRYTSETVVGLSLGSLDSSCSAVVPLAGRRFPAPTSDESIILRITPRIPGDILLEGVSINYTRGWKHLWQTGDEQSGFGVSIKAR